MLISYLTNMSRWHNDGILCIGDNAVYKNEIEKQTAVAYCLYQKGKYQSAQYWLHSALQNKDAVNDDKISSIHNQIAILYTRTNNYMMAIDHLEKAIFYCNDPLKRSKLMINIAQLYSGILDYAKAVEILDKNINILKEHNDSLQVAISMAYRGEIYSSQKDFKSALPLYKDAYNYTLVEESTNKRSENELDEKNRVNIQSTLLTNIAEMFLNLQQPDSAIHYLSKTQQKIHLLAQHIKATIYISYGKAYMLSNQNKEAYRYFQEGLKMVEGSEMNSIKTVAYKELATLYSKSGHYKEAWQYEKMYQELYETNISAENLHKINQIRNRYELEKKDRIMIQKQQEHDKEQMQLIHKNNRLRMILISSGLSILVIIFFLRNQYNKNRYLNSQLKISKKERQIAEIEATRKGEESERERIATELHDHVVSELVSLQLNLKDIKYHHPELQKSERYSNLVFQTDLTINKLRGTTHNMMPVKLQEEGLKNAIEDFVNRFKSHRLNISFQCFGDTVRLKDETEKKILGITNELIQNIVKHSRATEALVQLDYYIDNFALTVEDNGVGIGTKHKRNEGIGWSNIRKTVSQTGGHIDIQSSEMDGSTILIEIPYDRNLAE